MKHTACLSLFIAMLAFPAWGPAQTLTSSPWRTFASVAYSNGGDVLVDGVYSNTGRQFSVRAGGGLQVLGGAQYALADGWHTQAALGYHTDRTNGENANFRFTRVPLELALYRELNQDWRVGVGLRYSLAAQFKATGAAERFGSRSLKASAGPLVEVQYFLASLKNAGPGQGAAGGIGLKWVSEKFYNTEISRFERDGSHLSVSLFAYF